MAGSVTYSKQLPDFSDLDNDSGVKPGYKVYILERDGGVSLLMKDADEPNDKDETLKSVFMNVDEAKIMALGLQDAIDRAEAKDANHNYRAKDC